MSTRATYQIRYADNYRNTSIYIYCHHDNYPTGAIMVPKIWTRKWR